MTPPDGTHVRITRATMPGVPRGTKAIARHRSPTGHSNLPDVVWLELDGPVLWSHGVSEAPGYWAALREFEVCDADH